LQQEAGSVTKYSPMPTINK